SDMVLPLLGSPVRCANGGWGRHLFRVFPTPLFLIARDGRKTTKPLNVASSAATCLVCDQHRAAESPRGAPSRRAPAVGSVAARRAYPCQRPWGGYAALVARRSANGVRRGRPPRMTPAPVEEANLPPFTNENAATAGAVSPKVSPPQDLKRHDPAPSPV